MQIPDDKLQEIADLATKMRDLELLIEAREADLTQAKDTLQNLSENLLPDAMAEIGMESFKLKDGTSITISKFYSGSIKPETAEAAFAWLRSTGNDSLIKREVKCMFGHG